MTVEPRHSDKLHEPAILEHQTRRMLADQRAHALAANFAGQWLYLRDLKSSNPDGRSFPISTTTCAKPSSAKRKCCSKASSTKTAPSRPSRRRLHFRERASARHYGIAASTSDFRRVPVPNDARRVCWGKQYAAGHLQRQSHFARAARKWILKPARHPRPCRRPTFHRSRRIRQRSRASSVRERMEEHPPIRRVPDATNHDPIGLSLENFDGVGPGNRDSGFKIDAQANWWMARGRRAVQPAQGASRSPDAFVGTMTEKLLMYGVGRETKYYDMPVVRTIMRDAQPNRYRFSDLCWRL